GFLGAGVADAPRLRLAGTAAEKHQHVVPHHRIQPAVKLRLGLKDEVVEDVALAEPQQDRGGEVLGVGVLEAAAQTALDDSRPVLLDEGPEQLVVLRVRQKPLEEEGTAHAVHTSSMPPAQKT